MDKTQMENKKYSAPFWSWNGQLTANELKRQMRIFKEMGLGGVFMHSRTGLKTPYLSKRWFKLINECIEEGKKLGLETWAYDEDRWPSGYAGGKVTRNPKYRLQLIYLHEESDGDERPEGKIIRKCKVKGKKVEFILGDAPHTSWYNGYCYLNIMNPDAAAEFLKLTHDKYISECGAENFPGIFTDEPQYGFVNTKLEWANIKWYSTPYDERLRARIQERFGYDILDKLPDLFYSGKNFEFSTVRYQYVQILTELFLENYTTPISDWFKKHNLVYTGHMMGEDTLGMQAWNCGDPMAFYPYFDMPGIDMLGERCFNHLPPRQLCSAARQFGQDDRLAELFGATGWAFSPEAHQVVGDTLQQHGINFRCQHLSAYTLSGEAKRDYPASISFHIPWWKDYARLEERFNRIAALVHGKDRYADILVITPVESVWGMAAKGFIDSKAVQKFDSRYAALLQKLAADHLAFDCGSEILLEKHGSVEKGAFRLNKIKYKAVVLPEMLTIRSSTVKLLEKFVKQGGILVAPAGLPERCDGEAADISSKIKTADEKLLQDFKKISVDCDRDGIVSSAIFSEKDRNILMLVNNGAKHRNTLADPWSMPPVDERRKAFPKAVITWNTNSAVKPCEYIPEEDRYVEADAAKVKDGWKISTSFRRLQTRIFVQDKTIKPDPAETTTEKCTYAKFPKTMKYKLGADNVLLLDHFTCSETGEGEDYILEIEKKLRKKLGMPSKDEAAVQPWAEKVLDYGEKREITLKTTFILEGSIPARLKLALEAPREYAITLNGKNVPIRKGKWFVDPEISTIALPSEALVPGENTLELRTLYSSRHHSLEAMYLLGNFAVDREGKKLTPLPRTLSRGDLTYQGMPFYSDSIFFKFDLRRKGNGRFLLKFPHFNGALVRAWADGKSLGSHWMQPCEIDLTDAVSPGNKTTVTLELVGTRRNLFGPFYTGNIIHASAPGYFHRYLTRSRLLIPFGWDE